MNITQEPDSPSKPDVPSIFKLSACLLYELLTMVALSIVFAGVFYAVFGDATEGFKRVLQQLFLWAVIGAYYLWCWTKSGQTLAMQAWHLKLVTQEGALLSMKAALIRYLFATLSLLPLGLGFLWAMADKQHLFLHDRWLKNRVVVI